MANRIHITNHRDLTGQEEWIFSVNGVKMKLFSHRNYQVLFSVLIDWKYKKGTSPVVAVDYKDINEDSKIYKLWSMKS